MIIGLAGKIESGKDTVGSYLVVQHGFTHFAFADAIKKEIDLCFKNDYIPLPFINTVNWLSVKRLYENRWNKPYAPEVRKLLQWWGTEFRRARNPDYWVNVLLTELAARFQNPSKPNIVITDVRFENEAEWIKDHGGVVWLVKRGATYDDPNIKTHVSERFCETYNKWDRIIENTGTRSNLYKEINLAREGM